MLPKFQNPFEYLKPKFEEIQKSIKIMVERTPESLIELSRYGWYIDMQFHPRAPIELYEKIKKGDIDFVDNYLCNYYSEKLNKIEDELCSIYAKRKEIFKEAFKCFSKKQYYAAIPLFLTQADGICFDKTQKLFFLNNQTLKRKKKYVPEVEEEIKRMSGGIMDILLEPMKNPTAINDKTDNIDNFPIRLNRHAILHGMETEYGTKINCLKIISLVSYLNEMLKKTSPNK